MTAPEQLTIDGEWVAYPLPKPARTNDRQRDLLRCVRHGAPLVFKTGEARLFYADAHGALRRLEAMGLVEHVARGKWRAT